MPLAAHEGCDHEHEETHTHTHADGSVCTGDHEHEETHTHTHADGTVCTGDHSHEETHTHTHADGTVCTGDHRHEETHTHTQADGTVCTGDHSHEETHTHTHADGTVCTGDHSHDHADHDHGSSCSCGHDHGHDHSGDTVVVKADAHSRHILAMQTEPVPAAGQQLVGSVYGTLSMPEHSLSSYALPSAGRVTLAVKSAQVVHKGDLLYTLVSPEVGQLSVDLAKARAAVERCRVEIQTLEQRVVRLKEAGTRNSELESQLVFKRAELDQATSELENTRALLSMKCLGAELKTDNGIPTLRVYATADGTVRNVGFTQGSWGEQGAAVISMADSSAMEVVATLHAYSVPEIGSIRVSIPEGSGTHACGAAWRLDDQVDKDTQTRTLYVSPETLPAGARAGKLCRVDLYGGKAGANTVTIPDSAIVKVGVDDVVFVEVAEGTYAMVKVHAGESRRGMTPVEGLVPGQKIVVKGGYELRYLLPADGQAKKAGHFHADGQFHEGED